MDKKIILYTMDGCPKCKILKTKLDSKKIEYITSGDFKEIIEKGFLSAPVLQVGDDFKEFSVANKWINEEIE